MKRAGMYIIRAGIVHNKPSVDGGYIYFAEKAVN